MIDQTEKERNNESLGEGWWSTHSIEAYRLSAPVEIRNTPMTVARIPTPRRKVQLKGTRPPASGSVIV